MVNNLIYYRMLSGHSRNYVIKKLNLCEKTVRQYERGELVPKVDNAIRMAQMYGCTVEDLFCKVISKEEFNRALKEYKHEGGRIKNLGVAG